MSTDVKKHHSPFSPELTYQMSKYGMWIFLATEILFFAGLFATYSIYRYKLPNVWHESHNTLSLTFGAINTIVLLLSSFTVALAVDAIKQNKTKLMKVYIVVTLICSTVFMVNKFFEYKAKTHEYIVKKEAIAPEYLKALEATDGMCSASKCKIHPFNPANFGSRSKSKPVFANAFYLQYFVMTGVHGLHIIIGMGLFIWLLLLSMKNRLNSKWYTPVEVIGLYWHLVDLIWIFLFPLFYLIQ